MAASGLLQQGRALAERVGLPVQRAEDFVRDKATPLLLKKLSVRIIPFVRRSGVRMLEAEPGRVVAEMPLKGNVNHFGTMYAGALFTLAEFPGGPLFAATFDWRRYIPIVTDLDMRFVKVAKGPVRVELRLDDAEIARIQAALDADGRAAFELEGELKDAAGEVVARSHAQYQIREKR